MAEALGLAASAFSVVSLAIQLGDSLQRAWEFWDSIEDGPDDIRRLSTELRLLANILLQIQREYEVGKGDRVEEQMLKDALELARQDIDELAKIVTDMSRAIRPDQKSLRRKWGRVQIVLQGGKIAKLKGYIDSAKSILNLLQSTRAHSAMTQMNGKLALITATFTSVSHKQLDIETKTTVVETETVPAGPFTGVATKDNFGLRLYNKTTTTSWNTGLFRLGLRSTSSRIIDDDNESNDQSVAPARTTYVVNMAWRFLSCRRGFRVTTNNNFDAWTFNPIRTQPGYSQIFVLSRNGDTRGVHKLLLSGEASLSDVDTDGWTLLHYACHYGRSELARFLVCNGADVYQQDDQGETPIQALARFDFSHRKSSPQRIAEIMDVLIRDASFDPFDFRSQNGLINTCVLFNGLPYENIRVLLTAEACASLEQQYDFINDNLTMTNPDVENGLESIDFLLTNYGRLRGSEESCYAWPFWGTILQILIQQWAFSLERNCMSWEQKISRAFELTGDLFRTEGAGTTLDTVAGINGNIVQNWLDLLRKNGVDLGQYIRYEQSQHPDGVVKQPRECCRIIYVKFFGVEDEDELGITLTNVCNPCYEHLDPEYRCDKLGPRENCISQIDPVFVGDDGRPVPALPGSWTPRFKPNKELHRVFRGEGSRWMYVENVLPRDLLWEKYTAWWAEDNRRESEGESEEEEESEEEQRIGGEGKSEEEEGPDAESVIASRQSGEKAEAQERSRLETPARHSSIPAEFINR